MPFPSFIAHAYGRDRQREREKEREGQRNISAALTMPRRRAFCRPMTANAPRLTESQTASGLEFQLTPQSARLGGGVAMVRPQIDKKVMRLSP